MTLIPGQKIKVDIERMVPRGYGIAHADGATIFVALAAPGDSAVVEVREQKGGVVFAEIDEVLDPSPQRVAPRCEYFGSCGGCDYQQMTYSEQLASKITIIKDCLRRIGKIEIDNEAIKMIFSPAEFGYRSRAQWHLDPIEQRLGYYRRNSRDLVDIKKCPILVPELERALEQLRTSLDWDRFGVNKPFIDASVGSDGKISLSSPDLGESEMIEFNLGDIVFRYSAAVFFQGNHGLVGKLVDLALDDYQGKTALDLYSGVGLFSLPLARRFENVIAVEESSEAVRLADVNARANKISNVEFVSTPVRRFLAGYKGSEPDLVLLDPPRAGTEKETIHRIIELSPRNISYVSCEPSVLARDLKRFLENGYRITSITGADLFPQTHHVETVAHLTRL